METKDNLEKLRRVLLKSLDDINANAENPWVEPNVLADISGTTTTQIAEVILNFNDFVENSSGKISTRKFYESKTPFFKKLKDSSTGIIE